jgi:hypothetical protein
MHANQLTVSADTVRELVDQQFPEWHGLPIRAVASHGTANTGSSAVRSRLGCSFARWWSTGEHRVAEDLSSGQAVGLAHWRTRSRACGSGSGASAD